jgi:hypothetical protein
MLITALGTILSEGANSPVYVRKAASSFMTQQLLRPGGVMGLCESVFGEEETTGESVKLDKLEQLSRTLVSIPGRMTPEVSASLRRNHNRFSHLKDRNTLEL